MAQQTDDDLGFDPVAPDDTAAVNLVRSRVAAVYKNEPDSQEELAEVQTNPEPLSKHQQFMYELNNSGRSLADIQTAWHNYYQQLPDNEKHEVWQEFYQAHEKVSYHTAHQSPLPESLLPQDEQVNTDEPKKAQPTGRVIELKQRTEAEIRKQLLSKVEQRGKRKLSRKDHFKSMGFGMSVGVVVIFVLMFTFFNERFITPFITPSTRVSATPIIVDPTNNTVDPAPRIIIPKINVDIPVLYNVTSIDESAIQDGLDGSVVHYPTTSKPGELGNGVIFGHSSSNIFLGGTAKFAFLHLHELEEGDTFYINKDSKQYVYRVIGKRVVPPTEVSVLNDTLGKPATFTLITCDPPGLNINRLVVTGEQISPSPTGNAKSTATIPASKKPATLPGNSESLWHRFTSWLEN